MARRDTTRIGVHRIVKKARRGERPSRDDLSGLLSTDTIETALTKLRHQLDKLWVRIAAIAVLSFVAIGVARLTEPLLPGGIMHVIGAGSVNEILNIIANSMLAVTTFSLTVMVSVYRSASSQWTPRVHRLLLDDKVTQNTLATFIGAYIYALSSIILLRTELFADDQVVVLFAFTIAVLMLIVFAIIRWIVHLSTFGSLVETLKRVEEQARDAFRQRLDRPCFGARPMRSEDDIPPDAASVKAERTGYIGYIYTAAIAAKTDDREVDVWLTAPVGRFVFEGEVIARLKPDDEEMRDAVNHNVVVDDVRDFEQDPRFGIIVLSEIASKALSPGINDPGTAIEVTGRIGRLIEEFRDELAAGASDPDHERLWIPPLDAADLIEDGFDPIARDGAGVIEVQIMVQKVLARLARHPSPSVAEAAKIAARRAFERAESALTFPGDLDRLRAHAPEGAEIAPAKAAE